MILFLIIGIAMLIGGVYVQKKNSEFIKNSLVAEATITNIRTYGSRDSVEHVVDVEFVVDGEHYTGELNEYSSSMYVGKKVKIYYDPACPGNFRGKSIAYGGYILIIMGAFFVLSILVPLISTIH